jgi:uncharacterized membrane protein
MNKARLLLGFLLVSVLLNLLLAGVIIGRWSAQHSAGGAGQVVRTFLQAVPAETRPILARETFARRAELRQQLTRLRAARAAIIREIERDPLDEAALDAAFSELSDSASDLRSVIQEMAMAVIRQASAHSRREWAARQRMHWSDMDTATPALGPE